MITILIRKFAGIVAALTFSLPATSSSSLAQSKAFTVWGVGNYSCGAYLSDSVPNTTKGSIYRTWLHGFLTGINHDSSGDILAGTDIDGAEGWIANFCHGNPTALLATAASTLVATIRQRK